MLMTVAQAAQVLSTSTATIYRCIKAGAPYKTFGVTGKRYRVDPDQLIQWMDRCTQYETTLDLTTLSMTRHRLMEG